MTPRIQLLINVKRYHTELLESEGLLKGFWRGPIIHALDKRIKRSLRPKRAKAVQIQFDFDGRKAKRAIKRRKKHLKNKRKKR